MEKREVFYNIFGIPLCCICQDLITEEDVKEKNGLCRSCYKQEQEKDGIYED